MRITLWFLAIFAAAVGIALFAAQSQGTITLFWPPDRVDMSINLALLILLALFVVFYLALRAVGVLLKMPQQARAWRALQRERAMHAALQGSLGHLLAGRFSRARKLALQCVDEASAAALSKQSIATPLALHTQTLGHMLAAEAGQSLQDQSLRDAHLKAALNTALPRDALYLREGAQLRAAGWALQERDASTALSWLASLPGGVQRRTVALRLKLRAARQGAHQATALETARLLVKHGGFSADAGPSIVRSLALAHLREAHDAHQVQRAWAALSDAERVMPEVAIEAAQRLHNLSAANTAADSQERQQHHNLALGWLQTVWKQYPLLNHTQQDNLVNVLEPSLLSTDTTWLAQLEEAQRTYPRDARLQFLTGMACMQRKLWGKAQQLLQPAAESMQHPDMQRRAWRALATLAEQRGDTEAALTAWKRAAQS